MANVEQVQSKDGSSTLWAPDFDEHYHSIHGALTESMHVFIQSGLHQLSQEKDQLHIFEMGFGTGLNAFLTMIHRGQTRIHYTSIEKFPLLPEHYAGLNYGNLVEQESGQNWFQLIHRAEWEKDVEIEDGFILNKKKADLLTFEVAHQFDLIYFDAFAPSSQPDLWSEEIMQKIFSWCRPEAIFVTYSAKGDVRRALISSGFEVEKIPGPPGKREMLRGIRPIPSA